MVKKVKKKGELTKVVLKTLLASGVAVAVVALPGLAHITRLFDNEQEKKEKLQRRIYELEKRGFVERYAKKGKKYIRLTKKGRIQGKRYATEDIELTSDKKWDGKWRLVMFDIPRYKNVNRRMLYQKFLVLGVEKYQDSVYIYPYSCEEEISQIARAYSVESHIRFIEAVQIDDAEKFKKKFDLINKSK